jgi:WXG100 family type VII secretion target
MTYDIFDVETAVLRQQGQNFADLGGDFSNASKRLQSTLEGLGEPWAGADFGEIFGQVYTPIRDGIFTSMDSLAERLQQIGQNLQDMAGNYDDADASNSVVMNGLAGQL